MWFRGLPTMPARVGDFDLSKPAVAVLNVLVDDYAEVWINGQMPRRSGYPSPATIQGLNMPNRVVLGTEVKPGDRFQLAVFAINGPMSGSVRKHLVSPGHGRVLSLMNGKREGGLTLVGSWHP